MASVFCSDNDTQLLSRLSLYLELSGFSVSSFVTLSELGKEIQQRSPDLLVMELDYEDGDGLAFLRKVHSRYPFSVIVTSTRTSESDRILAFELGADDFVQKPYSLKELTLRVNAILSRRHVLSEGEKRNVWKLRSSSMTMNSDSHLIYLDDREIRLTTSEWKLFMYFTSNAGAVLSRQTLLTACFPECLESYDRVIDTHVKNIRAKLGTMGSEWIETVRGYGYRFSGRAGKT